MIYIDAHSRNDWKDRGIREIYVSLVTSGCEGTEVRLSETLVPGCTQEIQIADSEVIANIMLKDIAIFEGARITGVKGKWILTGDQVLTRCGCGKSFSIKSGNMRNDKIKLLKSKLSKKPLHTL